MIQPSIHKRDIESSRMVVCGALFDMRDLAQMLAHVHDAAMEVGEGPETPVAGGAPAQ
jgi:sugar (pentulose or hexulose) kinase